MLLAGELKHRPTPSTVVAVQIAAHTCRSVDVPCRIQGHSCKGSCSRRPSAEFMQNGLLAGGIQHEYCAAAGAAILTSAIWSRPVDVSFFVQSQSCVYRREIGSAPREAVEDRLLAGLVNFEDRSAAVLRGCAVWTSSSLNRCAVKITLVVAD